MHLFCVGRAVILCVLFVALPLQAAQIMRGHVPESAKGARALGRLSAEKELHLSLGLPLRNQPELRHLLQELYRPGSPEYRKFLSVEQFTDRFGPAREDYAEVIKFVSRHGLRVTATHPNRLLMECRGTVAQIEKALHVRLLRYRHPSEPREFFAPETEPWLDLSVPVLDIAGLNDLVVPRPASLVTRTGPQPRNPRPLAGSGPGGSYRGWDFRAAYAPGVILNGSGQYVGLVQFDGYYPGDITAYVSRVPGLTNVALTNILLNGFDGSPGENNVEVALDIQMAISMAPGLSGVLVYEGLSPNSILNRMATDNIARQLSASWSYPINVSTTQIFQQFAAQGQSFFNASGDDGAYATTVHPPTDHPWITSVGGTTLSTRGPAAGWLSETTWNWFSTGSGTMGSSGGISPTYAIPSWQEGLDMSTNKGSATMRNIPDVAMVGDNVAIIANNGQELVVGGTSVAAPLWAAYLALVNQQAALSSQPPVGFINPAIYALGRTSTYTTAFHDIRTGNNTNLASPTAFFAVPGYDLCTGWGTPAGKNLINHLAPPPTYPVLTAAGATLILDTCTPTNGVVDNGEPVIMRFSLQNYGGVATTNLVATLLPTNGIAPASPPQSFGSIAQGATASRAFTFVATGTCGAPVDVCFKLQDGDAELGTVVFPIFLGAPREALAQNFDSVNPPSLPGGWTRAATGGVTNWATSSVLRDTQPNSAFAPDGTTAGVCDLFSPTFQVGTTSAVVNFRHSYNLESDPGNSTNAFDGGVLELRFGSSPSRDILVQGGSFAAGGYVRTILATNNPLNTRLAWSGNSGGFVTTSVNLPASAAGQNVQLRWRLGMNSGNSGPASGWYVDSISVKDGYTCCVLATNADLALSQTVYPSTIATGQTLAYTLTVQNLGPGPALNVQVTNTPPENATFVWASPGYSALGRDYVWDLGLFPVGRATNLTVLVMPTEGTELINVAHVESDTYDLAETNNTVISIVAIASTPVITQEPTNQLAVAGADVAFMVRASGTEPLSYQWRFHGTNLVGETSTSLRLTNVQSRHAGVYSVTVSNIAGSTNSANATLSVLVPPTLALSPGGTGTNLSVSLTSIAGFTYTLEFKDALTDPDWAEVGSPVPGTGDIILLQDTNSVLPPTRFYRVTCR